MNNKKALVSAILAASAASRLTAADVSSISTKAHASHPWTAVYLSNQSFQTASGEYKVRATFRAATEGSNKYVGEEQTWGITLDDELIIDFVNVKTGEITAEGTARFLKNNKNATYQGYLCDSSKDCSENLGSFKAFTCDSTDDCSVLTDIGVELDRPGKDILVIKDSADLGLATTIGEAVSGPIVFTQVKK